ncbi:MAG: 4Fe-4S dicluster domain-containing protein [Deltaproteobacteria bacterium]|nr:4Fe-4S dicluster domain-containing protein [Deltaproteobacteria bacterium]TLN03357.1 MAG: 4Fe-4S dicluster domain-containing protein [bacterium]
MFMTKNVLKNLMTKYATRLYPFKKRETFKDVKGELKIELEKCILCSVCKMKCPSQCITVDKQAKSWGVDPFSCVYCGVCVDACPVKCLYQEGLYRAPLAEKDLVLHYQEAKSEEPAPAT